MENFAKYFRSIATGLLVFLWFYAAVSKWIDFHHFIASMHKQAIPRILQTVLIYGLPIIEIVTGAMLLTKKFFMQGLLLTASLFSIFSIYIALVLANVFGKIPCSCGGLIQHMGWTFHLFFNLSFLALTITSIIIHQRKENGDKE